MSNYKELLKSKKDLLLQVKNQQRKQRNIDNKKFSEEVIELINKDIFTIKQNKKNREETLYDIYSDSSLCVVCYKSLSRINVLLSQYGVKGRVKQDKNGTFILQIIKIGE